MWFSQRFLSRMAAGRAHGAGGWLRRAAGNHPSGRRLRLERLEQRTVLSGGVVLTSITGWDHAHASFLDSDENIVMAGSAQASGQSSDFAVLRYKPDGTLDPTFGNGGIVVTDVRGLSDAAYAAAYDGNRILAAGYAATPTSDGDFAVVRYNPNGSLDPEFGRKGKVTTDTGGLDLVHGLVIQDDAKIVAAGVGGSPSLRQFTLARYTSSGKLDAGFAAGGIVHTAVGDGSSSAEDVALHQGKILAFGQARNDGGETGRDFALVRYNLDGTVDQSFAVAGQVLTDFGPAFGTSWSDDVAGALAVDAGTGRILAAGNPGEPLPGGGVRGGDFGVACYDSNGNLDSTFGEGGLAVTDFGAQERVFSVAIQPDGKIVVAGSTEYESPARQFVLARFNSDGSLDAGFGTGGKVITSMCLEYAEIRSVVIQSDGKIVASGVAGTGSSIRMIALARYNSDGTLDETFGVPAPSLSINDVSVTEGHSGTVNAVFTVTRSGDTSKAVSVTYSTADGTATAPSDYTAISATTLSFGVDETIKTITVAVNGDTTKEPNETFFVNLTNATGGAVISDGQGVGTIVNDDGKPPKSASTASLTDAALAELAASDPQSGKKAKSAAQPALAEYLAYWEG